MEMSPTDVVANDLAIRLFLFGLAVMSFYEGLKLEKPRAYIAWAACALFLVLGAALTPISNAWPTGVQWVDNLVSDPVTWFVLLMAFYLIMRPRWTVLPESPPSERLPAYDDTRLKAEVAELTRIKRAIIDDYQRMSGVEVRFTDALDRLKEAIQQKDQTVGANFGALQDRVVAVDATYAGELAGLKAQMSLTADALRQQFECVYLALGAIFHRERLHTFAESIEAGAKELASPTAENASLDSDQWEAWQANERGWMRTVETWCDLAENYVPGIKERVTTTTRDDYLQTGQAKVEQFPTPEAYTAYKGFCAIWKNWRNWQLEAIRAVHQAAFNRGGRRPVGGGGDMEELGGPT